MDEGEEDFGTPEAEGLVELEDKAQCPSCKRLVDRDELTAKCCIICEGEK